ncbi:MAG: hypothetical protein ACTMUB_01285 [cyanobacterium endosymbiont of Rhopalodia musculus]|uniref:hypothetical protein n=1 Tax=cyanobacterium endosymbiont of Epithemia clementina EcSB TaxID=3034674 RepID=UPI0024800120|nr:hypothetical protein [cyanobacterium endosymbiont of Epithemia clementina EcSB]WGT66895.1 hypothetical protein P3F56_06495 [cyanobacterium endosymbiont of Epithemia clementina EcSB]
MRTLKKGDRISKTERSCLGDGFQSPGLKTYALLEALYYYGSCLALTNLDIYFQECFSSMGNTHTFSGLSRETSIVVSSSLAVNRLSLLLQPSINPTSFTVASESVKRSVKRKVCPASLYPSYLHPPLPMFFLPHSNPPRKN